jgi:membrane-associated phospholipid phosphatase
MIRTASLFLLVGLLSGAAQAQTPDLPVGVAAQSTDVRDAARQSKEPSFVNDLFTPLGGDFLRLSSKENLLLLGVGGAAAIATRPMDGEVAGLQWGGGTLKPVFQPGQQVGDFLIQAGGAVATYSIGRATGSARVASLGASLFRAQIVAQATAQAVKYGTQRTRPDGTPRAFPSGHTASAFAMATVLQSELGWKVGVPAYAVATWVGASRVHKHRHFVSDVVAGATLGLMAGRSVTVGVGGARFSLSPAPVAGGIGVNFTKTN